MSDTIISVDFGPNGVGGENTTQVVEPWASDDPRYVALAARVTALRSPTPVAGFPNMGGMTDAQIRATLAVEAPRGGDPRDAVAYLQALDQILAG